MLSVIDIPVISYFLAVSGKFIPNVFQIIISGFGKEGD